jgi:hypothetical protein
VQEVIEGAGHKSCYIIRRFVDVIDYWSDRYVWLMYFMPGGECGGTGWIGFRSFILYL